MELGPSRRTFTLQVFSGDLQIGYRRTVIQYRDAELFGADEATLASWLEDPETEMLQDEIDRREGSYEHRHLLWPRGEFGVRFGDAVIVTAAATLEQRNALLASRQA